MTTKLGAFTRWERPEAITIPIVDDAGVVIDISGLDVQATWELRPSRLTSSGVASANARTFACSLATDGTDGLVSVPWGDANPSPFDEPGLVEIEVWASDGAVRYASEIHRFTVREAVADAQPPILGSATGATGRWVYQGEWNASTNDPALASGVGTLGDLYVVGTSGATLIDGESSWGADDLIWFDGTAWRKIQASVGGAGAGDLISTNNLSDLDDAATARTNLGVYSTAQVDSAIDADIVTHTADTTSVHGITDTSALETTTGAQAKADAAQAAAVQRANHTGTQAASTISDFSSFVAGTAAVTANTAKVTNATHTGDVTGDAALTIANDAVTNAKAANMAQDTLKGRVSSGSGDPEDLTPAQGREVLQVAGPEMHYYSAVYGDWTGTPATDTANLIAAITAWAGSTIVLPPRDVSTPVVLTETIEIPTRTILRGPGSSSLAFELDDGVDDDMFRTEDFATLTGTNAWLASAIPVGFGLEGVRLLGNSANNTAGSAFVAYGKRPWLVDVIVGDFAEHGFWLEAGAAGGQSETDDLPEGWCHHLFAKGCALDGFHILGPHDNRFGSVYAIECGQWGFWADDPSLRNGAFDMNFIHVYACEEGIFLGCKCSIESLQTESNYKRGISIASTLVTIGQLVAFRNHRDHSASSDAPHTDISVELTSGATHAQVGTIRARADYGGTCVEIGAVGAQVGQMFLDGETTGARLLHINANTVQVGQLIASDASGTGGIAVELAVNRTQLDIKGYVATSETLVKFNNGTGHQRCRVDLTGFASGGQTSVSGTATGATSSISVRTNDTTYGSVWSSDVEIDGALNHDGSTVGFFGVTPATRAAAYTVTNGATDRAFDANATTLDELADVLGTLIADLRTYGLVQ